jgi:hypothetical protein
MTSSSSNDTDREALIELVDHERRGWARMGSGLTPELVDAILTKFLPGHDERVKAETWAKLNAVRTVAERIAKRDDLPAGQAIGITILDILDRRES